MYLRNIFHWLKAPRQHRTCRPSQSSTTLNLEVLEDRWLPNGAVPTASPAPPSFTQAAVSLYLDGIQLEAIWQVNVTAFKNDFGTGSKAGRVLRLFGNPDLNSIEGNIAFNMPYAGSFGSYFVLAGKQAMDQFLQQS